MPKQVTIIDVADAAGVSRQTVTRAMNDMADISQATRKRVLDAAERLGYRPSRFARNLVTRQKTRALGLVVASMRNPYYTDIAADFLEAAPERGWQIVLGAAAPDGAAASIAALVDQVDVIVGHFGTDDGELLDASGGIPIVKLESTAAAAGVHSVEVDIEAGISLAVETLRASGAHRLGLVDSAYPRSGGHEYSPSPRREFFERTAGESIADIVVGEETITGGGAAFSTLLDRHPDVDGVLMFNDLMALGAVSAAHARGLAVPGDVRIMGIDGLALGDAVEPSLTSVSLEHRGLARAALDIADEVSAGGFASRESIRRVITPVILRRGSA